MKILSELLLKLSGQPYCVLALCVFSAYCQSLFYGYIGLDDGQMIRDNLSFLIEPSNVFIIFKTHYFAAIESISRYYRPLVNLSFMIDSVVGRGFPGLYHLTNIILHFGVSVLVYKFIFVLLDYHQKDFKAEQWALAGASLFAVHPANVMGVGWIMGRNDVLFSLFALLCILSFHRFFFRNQSFFEFVHGIALFLALLTKESGVVLPVVCVLMVLFFRLGCQGNSRNIIEIIRTLPWITWLSVGLIWMALRGAVLGQAAFIGAKGANLMEMGLLVTLMIRHFGKLFLPINLSLTPTPEDTSIVPGVISLGLCVLAVIICNRENRRVLLWVIFSIALLFYISVPFLNQQDMYVLSLLEHRLYMPNCLAMIGLFYFLGTNLRYYTRKAILFSCLVTIFFMGMTINRLVYFKDPITFWTKSVALSPSSDMAHLNFGAALLMEDRVEEGKVHIEKALSLNPRRSNGHLTLAKYYERKKMYNEAREEYRKEQEAFPNNIAAYFALSAMCDSLGLKDEAAMWNRKGLEKANQTKNKMNAL